MQVEMVSVNRSLLCPLLQILSHKILDKTKCVSSALLCDSFA